MSINTFDDSLFSKLQAPPKLTPEEQQNRLEPEYAQAFTDWQQTPTPQTSSAFLRAVEPVLNMAVKPLGNSPTLRGQAKRLTLQAAGSYDPQRGSLKTHLMSHLQGLKRIAATQDSPIQMPERQRMQYQNLNAAEAELRDSLGRDPADSELADATGLSLERLAKLRRALRPVSESAFSGSEEGDGLPGVQRTTPLTVWHEYIRSELSPRDQLLLDYAAGANGQTALPSVEIAKRLGITPGAVSQRLAMIQGKLNELDDLDLLGT